MYTNLLDNLEEVDKIAKHVFGGAAPLNEVFNICKHLVESKFSLDLSKTIAAVSVCPDELNNSLIANVKECFGEPFHLGGLSGYPFTGVTGFNAFGDHVPDGGNAIVVFGPHIGIVNGRLGYVHRHGQALETMSCGALLTAYQSALNGKEFIEADTSDFQQHYLIKMISNKPDIDVGKKEKQLAELILKESHAFIREQSRRIKERFNIHKIILLGIIIFNTPKDVSDYISLEIVEEL